MELEDVEVLILLGKLPEYIEELLSEEATLLNFCNEENKVVAGADPRFSSGKRVGGSDISSSESILDSADVDNFEDSDLPAENKLVPRLYKLENDFLNDILRLPGGDDILSELETGVAARLGCDALTVGDWDA
jgi:hypothetical protein